ncbi:WzyE family oligosaccharide polymerase, partial [Vibrio cholerae]|uniref:WzyE family oligosaccharide polymerase n=1 Tax=Vibrio cholerae TaxID=666 RepID=UPI00215D2B65
MGITTIHIAINRMVLSYTLILLSLVLLLIFLARNGVCIRSISALFLFVTHFVGYPILHVRYLLDPSYPSLYDLKLDQGVILSFFGFFVFLMVSNIFKKRTNCLISLDIVNSDKINIYYYVYWVLFVVSISYYLVSNGFSFNSDGNYGDRLEDNAGNGLLLINMAAFIPALIIGLMRTKERRETIKLLYLVIFSGALFFFVIGGSRNVLAGALLVFIYISYIKGYLGKKFIVISGLFLLVLMNMLVLIRYNVSIDNLNVKDLFLIFLSYLVDSISPVYYQAITVDIFLNSSLSVEQGWDLFFNQFFALIPRGVWPDKPIVMMNSSYYFTQYILNLPGNLNMAATLLSSSIIIMGWHYYILYVGAAIFVC